MQYDAKTREALKDVIRMMAVSYPERFEGCDVESLLERSEDFDLYLIRIAFTNDYEGPDGRNRLIGLYKMAQLVKQREATATAMMT